MPHKELTFADYTAILKKFAIKKGLLFNPDDSVVNPLIEGLLANRNRYGYPSCPCRLAAGDFDLDQDIICPCVYAVPDMDQYGKCYCELYVSQNYLDGNTDRSIRVPERRPPEKMFQ